MNYFKVIVLCLYLAGCKASQNSIPEQSSSHKLKSGIVKDMRGLDGCAFLIYLTDGSKIQPVNLDTAFMKDNLKVRVQYVKENGMSVCMSGEMVRINKIEKEK